MATPWGTPKCAPAGCDMACTEPSAMEIAMLAAISMFPRATSSSGVSHRALEVVADHPQRLQRAGVLVRAPVHRHVGLHRVRHGVHPGGRRHRRGQGARGLRIEDRQPREEREVGDLELDLVLVVLDHRGHRHLAAGAGGGGHARQRGDVERPAHAVVLARHEEEALLVAGAAAVGEHRVGHLRRVHHRSAAHREERVGARLLGGGGAALHHVGRRVLGHVVEHAHHLEAAVAHAVLHALHEAGAADHLVGDHEHALRALLEELEADRAEQVAPRDHPGGRRGTGRSP